MSKGNGAGNRDRRGNRGETPLRERFRTLYEHAPFGLVMFYKDLDAGIEFLQKPFSPSAWRRRCVKCWTGMEDDTPIRHLLRLNGRRGNA
jgi:hypothetical protein